MYISSLRFMQIPSGFSPQFSTRGSHSLMEFGCSMNLNYSIFCVVDIPLWQIEKCIFHCHKALHLFYLCRICWSDFFHKPNYIVYFSQVLDNLPHDLIYAENQVSPWMEVWVEKQHDRYKVFQKSFSSEDSWWHSYLILT